jgi:uncharacterized protein YbjT (DUF2867 family)
MVRNPNSLSGRVGTHTQVVKGDVRDISELLSAMKNVDTAYYLIHSMGSSGDFEAEDRIAATNFAAAAKQCGVRRIIYLGGLGQHDERWSKHLRSRHEVGEILRESGSLVIEFQASIIIGSGSLSFELIRNLVERLPLMITPRWVSTPAQPIGIRDLLKYLYQGLNIQIKNSMIFEIGGTDVVSYGQLMGEYANQRNLRRLMIPVPVLTPRLSSWWLGLVTPVYSRVGRKLINSMRYKSIIQDHQTTSYFDLSPMGIKAAISDALINEDQEFAQTRWSDALSSAGHSTQWGGTRFGTRLVDTRSIEVTKSPKEAFAPIKVIGGNSGWYHLDWLWRIRGFLDLLVGGVGVRRGRRDPFSIHVGDTIDWWRVEQYQPDRKLRLVAEMKVPGRAWLEFEVTDNGGGSTIRQTAIFDPVGIPGLFYWYFLYPLHNVVFSGMIKNIAKQSG